MPPPSVTLPSTFMPHDDVRQVTESSLRSEHKDTSYQPNTGAVPLVVYPYPDTGSYQDVYAHVYAGKVLMPPVPAAAS